MQLIYKWPDENFTLEKITDELVREENRLRQVQADQDEVSALAVSSKSLTEKCATHGNLKLNRKYIQGKTKVL